MPKILLAEDNEEMLETLENIFRFYDFEVEKAENGKQAVELARETNPDLILLDGMMPIMDGFEACRILKSDKQTKDIPIVFLTANYIEEKDKITGFELGADDYILKPFNSKELVARSKSILQRHAMLHELKSKNTKLSHEKRKIAKELQEVLSRKTPAIEEQIIIDSLTGVYTHSYFLKRLKEEFGRAQRYQTPLSLVLIGLKGFDKIKDKLGNEAASYIMIKMANHLLSQTRTSDVLARSIQDTFLVILPHTSREGALREAERIRSSMHNMDFLDEELLETLNISKRRLNEYRNSSVNIYTISYPDEEKASETGEDLYKALCEKNHTES